MLDPSKIIPPILAGLPDETVHVVMAAAIERSVPAGAALFHEEDAADQLTLILGGSVRVWRTSSSGAAITLHVLGPGDIPGCVAVIRRTPYPASATTSAPTRILTWPAERIRALISQHPPFAANLLDVVAARNEEMLQRLHEVSTLHVPPRVARVLIRMIDESGRPDVAQSRQDIAELAATTLHTVSRLMSRWHRDGVVRAGRGRVLVLDRARLEKLAEG
ncbi:Crp/Fnr family transcriptional regulator [Sphingomonas floccifaciens]|uniref:Crp/Fnr family transcriptional regulator n=1 Tax=Sphingomonas floccifaciens TaxID=1844115 RepID=A0ABW4NBP5_9SPHN